MIDATAHAAAYAAAHAAAYAAAHAAAHAAANAAAYASAQASAHDLIDRFPFSDFKRNIPPPPTSLKFFPWLFHDGFERSQLIQNALSANIFIFAVTLKLSH